MCRLTCQTHLDALLGQSVGIDRHLLAWDGRVGLDAQALDLDDIVWLAAVYKGPRGRSVDIAVVFVARSCPIEHPLCDIGKLERRGRSDERCSDCNGTRKDRRCSHSQIQANSRLNEGKSSGARIHEMACNHAAAAPMLSLPPASTAILDLTQLCMQSQSTTENRSIGLCRHRYIQNTQV